MTLTNSKVVACAAATATPPAKNERSFDVMGGAGYNRYGGYPMMGGYPGGMAGYPGALNGFHGEYRSPLNIVELVKKVVFFFAFKV